MSYNKLYSAALVTAQFVLIIGIYMRALPATFDALLIPGALLIVIAIVVAIFALITLKLHNLSVMPEPVSNGELVTTGPYRYIRHPMYTSVLLGCLGMLLLNLNILSCGMFIALAVILIFKIRREESLLKAAYPAYEGYKIATGALLPKLLS